MPDTIRPIIVTHDLDRLRAFYTSLLAAEQIFRYPDDGDALYVGLRIGDSELGTATSGAHDMPWGQRVAHIRDPDGNVVNLTQQL